MTTVGDAIKAALDANWAGSGGTEPALYSSEDVGKEWPTDPDWIKVLGWTYRRRRKRRNDTFIGERYLIDMLVHSMNDANSEERLDTIVTEVYRIITPTNVTGFHDVDIVDESRAASDDYKHFMATLTVELTIKSTSAAVTPGSGGDGDVAFPADVEITGALSFDTGEDADVILDEDDMASDDADALATQQSIKAYVDAAGGVTDHGALTGLADDDHPHYVLADGTRDFTGDVTITGVGSGLTLTPADTGATQVVMVITPSDTVDGGAVAWKGLSLNGAALDPTAANTDLFGFDVDFSGVNMANNPDVYGTRILLPATYGSGTEYAGQFQGDGRNVYICTDAEALKLTGASTRLLALSPTGNGTKIFTISPGPIASGTWCGMQIYGANLDPSAGGCNIKGIDIDLDGVSMTNNPTMTGLIVTLPAAYGTGTEKAGYFAGDGRTLDICTDTEALNVGGAYTLDGMTQAYLEDLLMFGSANAAWVPMIFAYPSESDESKMIDGRHINTSGNNHNITFTLPLPCVKGSLKLYLKSLMYAVQDADAAAYIDSVRISGINANTRTDIDTDPTDHTAAGDKTFSGATFPAAVIDTSSYQTILIKMDLELDAANELDIHNIRMQCYYAA